VRVGLFLDEHSTLPLAYLVLVVVVVIGPPAISEVGLVLAFEPVARIGPVVLAVAVHPACYEIADVIGLIRVLNCTFTFYFVDVISQFDFSFVDNADSELYLYS
jgi:hypothetical protein